METWSDSLGTLAVTYTIANTLKPDQLSALPAYIITGTCRTA